MISRWKEYIHRDYIPGDTYRYVFQKNLDIQTSYVFYRFAICLGNTVLLVVVLFSLFLPCPPDTRKEYTDCLSSWSRLYTAWPFYLSNWGLSVNFVQSVLGFALTIRAYWSQRCSKKRNVTPPFLQVKNEHKLTTATGLFWSLSTASTVFAILIVLFYWTTVFDYSKKREWAMVINICCGHLFNLLVMVIDKCIVAYPVMVTHIFILLILHVCYGATNGIYYLMGGLDKYKEKHFLNRYMNWEEPLNCLLSSSLLMILSVLLIEPIIMGDTYKHKKFRPQQILDAYGNTTDKVIKKNESISSRLHLPGTAST
ncbi:hypothetical protein GE061_002066 [Apolygus lucorum]|uniref:Uncharacterized protein n=1 Tax=Apolygus lucorum TaxID=248454 RepID=A0A8S9X412_APOLU|nr:hypothetical protein GE061_002066 [Apolygus lucorum]